ncbi:MAG: hypothetical protein LRY68_06305 [Sulfurospirillum sp.]|nr:hypothetical protein [Sulfurospirillum sp.]
MLEIPPTKIMLNLSTLKPSIRFFPINKEEFHYQSDNPLVAVLKDKDTYKIMNGKYPHFNPQSRYDGI